MCSSVSSSCNYFICLKVCYWKYTFRILHTRLFVLIIFPTMFSHFICLLVFRALLPNLHVWVNLLLAQKFPLHVLWQNLSRTCSQPTLEEVRSFLTQVLKKICLAKARFPLTTCSFMVVHYSSKLYRPGNFFVVGFSDKQ